MVRAEAPLQTRSQVGISSPTMLQTLTNLLHLYNSGDTDKTTWTGVIESDPQLLCAFASAAPTSSLEHWHQSRSLEDLKGQTIALANQVQFGPPGIDEVNVRRNQLTSLICASLAGFLQLPSARTAKLTGQIVGMTYQTQESNIRDALVYYKRNLAELEDTDLLTRIVAVAYQNTASNPAVLEQSATLLQMDKASLLGIIEAAREEAARFMDKSPDADDFAQQLSVLNLNASFANLLKTVSPHNAFTQLAMAMFDTANIRLFMLGDNGWSDGEIVLRGRNSIIVAASSSGEPTSSLVHPMTVIDEKLIDAMGADEGLAIPIVSDTVAIVLVGVDKERLIELADNPELIEHFSQTASYGLAEFQPRRNFISREILDASAREIIHEANNPLSTTQNYLKVLSLKLGEEHEAQETITTISNELFRASDIIKRFRTIGDHTTVKRGRCKVNPVLSNLVNLFDQANQHISFDEMLDATDPQARMHTDDLKQIVSNLIKNSAEACQAGDVVSIASAGNLKQGTDSFVEISVKDNGPGIDESIANVFNHGTSTKSGDHTGEGLAVVKDLMDKANAVISYRTSPAGTEFRLTIPQYSNNAGDQS